MKIGYARVSTTQQDLTIQIDALKSAGATKLFSEKLSGKSTDNRQALQQALDFARDGDSLIVTRLDRLARSVIDLANIAKLLEANNVDLVVTEQQIDTRTPSGKLMFHMFAAFAEFERSLIQERCDQGRAKALANGVKFGRKAKLTVNQIIQLKTDFKHFKGSKTDLANKYGISRASLYRIANS